MKLVVISGRSGSGKSTALQALEDIGFYCIDNLPALLLPDLVQQMSSEPSHPDRIAVSIDARNLLSNLSKFPQILLNLRQERWAEYEVIFLDSSEATLLKRYSSTRRKHPLSDKHKNLQQSIQSESELLEPIASLADIRIDTTRLPLYDLRDTVKLRVAKRKEQTLSVQFESFGFKHGVPLDVDFVYDVRALPNPHWVPELRKFTGQEQPVQDFLNNSAEVNEMISDITEFLSRWLPRFAENNRSYITIGIGCTGGQHRSVYISERLASHFSQHMDNVHVRHRELS
ncbi:RNase adapter RapZ [Neptuniibacter sp. QD34_54]|uniref:RNase adapter RapZ n=1 Tax=Neptuniibacter sp. QD34_54 TaxID=3398208 RepID=UPI0039F4E5A0